MCGTGTRENPGTERCFVICVNDRDDPMMGSVEIPGAELIESGQGSRTFTAPPGEFTARLQAAGVAADRFRIRIGDPADNIDGVVPDIYYGVVESWQPAGSRILVRVRPARNLEEAVH